MNFTTRILAELVIFLLVFFHLCKLKSLKIIFDPQESTNDPENYFTK